MPSLLGQLVIGAFDERSDCKNGVFAALPVTRRKCHKKQMPSLLGQLVIGAFDERSDCKNEVFAALPVVGENLKTKTISFFPRIRGP